MDLSHLFCFSTFLSSSEFRGVSWVPLKTSGLIFFFPPSMAHISQNIKIHTVLITQICFGCKPDILILIILSQNEHQKCVKYTFFPA